MSKEEIWKDIKEYEGLYKISNYGNVKSLVRKYRKTEIILKFAKVGDDSTKYYQVGLCKNNIPEKYKVHRLVAIHFIGNQPTSHHEVNHKDYNPFNNYVNNLEWVTSSQNYLHSRENMSLSQIGEKHPRAKVTDKQAIEIKRMRKQNIKHRVIAEKFNITIQDSLNIATKYYSHINHLV